MQYIGCLGLIEEEEKLIVEVPCCDCFVMREKKRVKKVARLKRRMPEGL